MYKIMVVEDEPPILNMITDMINSKDNGFEVCCYAYNGRDALVKVKESTPDIVITDIRMPFMGGLELISRINELYPDIICIILSGYSDFEYAQKAVRLKVFDYLLKPVQSEELDGLLIKLYDLLKEKTEKRIYEYLSSIIYFGNADAGSFKPEWTYYNVILINAGCYSSQSYEISYKGKDFWNEFDISQFDNYIGSYGSKIWYFNGKYSNYKILIIASQNNMDKFIESICKKYLNMIQTENIPVNIVYSKAVEDPLAITGKLKKLTQMLTQKLVLGKSNIFSDEDKIKPYPALTSEEKKQILLMADQTSFENFKKVLKVIIVGWEKQELTQQSINRRLNYIKDLFQQKSLSDQNLFNLDINTDEILINSSNYDSIYENLCCLFKLYYDSGKNGKYGNFRACELVDKIEEYLKEHYTEEITYKKLYELFGYNEIYISNVFRKIKGISPSKYITKLRIDKAKDIIEKNPGILLKTVSEMVGYEDPLYFSRVFKEWEGISPSDFSKGL